MKRAHMADANRDTRQFRCCPCCGCTAFYRQKDFSHALGCVFLAAGFALVPWTYGLSLPALWLLDMALRRRVPDAAVCYRCRTVFRGADLPSHVEAFEHFTAMKWEARIRDDVRTARPVVEPSGGLSDAGMKNSSAVLKP
jgi:hypothetical protein